MWGLVGGTFRVDPAAVNIENTDPKTSRIFMSPEQVKVLLGGSIVQCARQPVQIHQGSSFLLQTACTFEDHSFLQVLLHFC